MPIVLGQIGKGWIVRGTITKRSPYWANGLLYPSLVVPIYSLSLEVWPTAKHWPDTTNSISLKFARENAFHFLQFGHPLPNLVVYDLVVQVYFFLSFINETRLPTYETTLCYPCFHINHPRCQVHPYLQTQDFLSSWPNWAIAPKFLLHSRFVLCYTA